MKTIDLIIPLKETVMRNKFLNRSMQIAVSTVIILLLQACQPKQDAWQWEAVETKGSPTARHEASFVEHKGKLYLIGGRRVNPTDVFDPITNSWSENSATPIELHHFQAVSLGDAIYLVGAMTGEYPNETPLDKVIAYYPETDTFEYLHEIPSSRRRGGAGAVAYKGKLYIVGGITNGHVDGFKPWLDEYNPMTGEWRVLPNAQFARDHMQAVVIADKLYVAGGRTSRQRTDQVLELLTEYNEAFDFKAQSWLPVTKQHALPTLRAGNSVMAWGDEVIVAGGESHTQQLSFSQVEAYNTNTGQWRNWPVSIEGRHGSGFAIYDGYAYIASGSAQKGGGPELTSMERIKLPTLPLEPETQLAERQYVTDDTAVKQRWHTVEIDFIGPEVSEQGEVNPFTDYRLDVVFSNPLATKTVRGFFAADGNAANSGAESGNVWRARFTPNVEGEWKVKATLAKGSNVAMSGEAGEPVELANAENSFFVIRSDKDKTDFRANGHLTKDGQYFRFANSGAYWIKAGANSPENILGFNQFDGTYRVGSEAREGEAAAGEVLHTFAPHARDWQLGDPTWQQGKGKNIIGMMNYLASKGMNSSYFLTMNINGDGNDVWPFVSHDNFDRFDVSKLAQWEVLFEHMQAKGILLHMVTQETENETLFDNGDTGPQRQLYLNELIARFAHHPALVWNLGEENGPAEWSPVAQNDDQRKAMSTYLKQADPYQHPVLLHTHSTPESKDHIVAPQLGHWPLDGLSFQVETRELVHQEVIRWHQLAKKAGDEWLITMDEIGKWHTGALADSQDPNHDTLRRYVLWGSLMAGGAGVEWYFGAKYPANDLTSEDWRLRDRLWTITNHARGFFERHIPYWAMSPRVDLMEFDGAYVFAKTDDVYLSYLPSVASRSTAEAELDLSEASGQFLVQWFDPLEGGSLQTGSVIKVDGGQRVNLGLPPKKAQQDWAVLLTKSVK